MVADHDALLGLTPEELATRLGGSGRAARVFDLLRAHGDPFQAGLLPPGAMDSLRATTTPSCLTIQELRASPCGTRKLVIALHDGECIETVLIPTAQRTTVCVSSQVGCARQCSFCVTATMGLRRGLTAAEIVGQVWLAMGEAARLNLPTVRNVVFMGMGEPLDNLANVRQSLAILTHPKGFALGRRHITVSTVGTSPRAISAMQTLPAQLAWSLHAASNPLRQRLVPSTRHSLDSLRDAFLAVVHARQDDLFVEVTLINGVNDSLDDAEQLTVFLQPFGPRVRVNLLPLNLGRAGLTPTPHPQAQKFRQVLRAAGHFCSLRSARGSAANAACGQLATLTRGPGQPT